MNQEHARLVIKTRLFTLLVVLSNVLGNFSLSRGLRRFGPLAVSPIEYFTAMLNPWVAAGIALLIVWLLAHMALLSWADLSYVLPVTSIGYVLVALSGKYLLGEDISTPRWAGILLIVIGVALVGRTRPKTSAEPKKMAANA